MMGTVHYLRKTHRSIRPTVQQLDMTVLDLLCHYGPLMAITVVNEVVTRHLKAADDAAKQIGGDGDAA